MGKQHGAHKACSRCYIFALLLTSRRLQCKGTIGAFLWPELAARSFRTLPRFCWSSG